MHDINDPDHVSPAVFIHIPKTAGTTLYSVIRHVYAPNELYKLHPTDESVRHFKALPWRKRKVLRLIYGHIDVSVGRMLPADTRFFTILRDPVERAISHYYQYRRALTDPLHPLAMQCSLSQWVSTACLAEMDNGQTRRLAGAMDLPYGEVSTRTLEQAKTNMVEKFAVTGLTERFAESQILLHRAFNWPLYRYPARNIGDNRLHQNEVSEEVLALIKNANRLDLELYQFARELFDQAVGTIDMAGELAAQRLAPEHIEPAKVVPVYRRALSGLKSLISAKHPPS